MTPEIAMHPACLGVRSGFKQNHKASHKSNQQTVYEHQLSITCNFKEWEDSQSSTCSLFKIYPFVNIRIATAGITKAIVIAVVTHMPCVEYPLAIGFIGITPRGGSPAGQM